MKVDFVNNQWQLGGAETVVHQLRAGLTRAGHKSRLYVADGKTYPRGEGVIPLYPRLLSRLSHTRLSASVYRAFPRDAWTDRRFRDIARSPADLIHIHNFHGRYATVPSLAYLIERKKVVWTFHAFWGITGGCDHPRECQRYQEACGRCPHLGEWPLSRKDTTSEHLRMKLKHLANKPLQIIAPSQHLAKKVRESQVGRNWSVHCIPNGIDPAQFGYARKRDPQFRASLGIEPASTTILIVNRDFKDGQKGYGMLEIALKAVDADDVQIILAGRNSSWATSRLQPRLRCLDVGYVSSRERLAQFYEAADIFLFASPAENFPCVILEAMSAKCCVIATPTSGVTEQVEHGHSGLLARAISGESLGTVLQATLAHRERIHNYGETARHRVESEFSEEMMISRHLRLYEKLMAC